VAFLDEMWQHWPAALRAEDGGLALALYGGQGTAPLDLRNDTAGGSPYGGLGVARTRTVWLWFPGADADAAAVHRAAAQFRHALRPVAPPKWVCFSGITGAPVWPCDPDLFPNEEKQFETAHLGIVHQRDAFDIHGFLDYGDVHHRWDSKNNTWDREYRYWVNNESTCESTTSLHWLQYLRTGKRKFYDFCEQRSWHLMDVDTIHEERPGPLSGQAEEQPPAEDRDPAYRRGVMHVHAINHWFSHAAADHTHADYALWHAHLSGGYRGFDVAAELADTARRGPLARLGCQWRGFHFPSRYAVDLYQHFWDEDLIEFARQNLDVPVVHYPPRVTIGGDDRPILSYDRYVRQTGDAWIRKRCIEGNAGPFVTGYTDHSRAILYSHTRNPDVLRLELLRRVGYAGVTRYLDPICADDFTKLTPPGYGWIYFGVPKYAWVMWALADAKLWPPRPEPAVVRTNAAGGGAWSEGKTWAGGRPPRPEEAAQVVAGDHLVADLPADDSVDCAGLKVEGRLTFGAGARSLVVSGDVVVAKGGSLEIGPGHALRIASEFNAARGLTVESGGSFQCRGASPKQPDAVLAALGDRDDVAAYAHFESGAKALVQNAEVRNLGMAWTFKGRAAATKRLEGRTGIASATADLAPFTGNRVVGCAFGLDLLAVPSKFEVRDCEFRRCKVGLNVRGNRGSEMAVTGCRFEQNETGATLTLSRDAKKPPACEVKGNVFARNTHSGVTLMAVGDSRLTVEDNTYEENEAGFESLSPGKATLARETFVGNRRGLAVQATELTVLAGRFGRSDAGDRANTEADVAFTTGGVTRATEQSGGVRLKGCTLASPVTVGSVERHGKAWVIAEDAAGGPAKPRVWGQPPPEPKPEK
jgi:hypothetical protein